MYSVSKIKKNNHLFRFQLPYCVKQFDIPRDHQYIFLNRDYKPLGIIACNFVDFSPYQKLHGFSLDQELDDLEGIWWKTKGYFYNDNPDSRKDYEERLSRFLGHITVSGPAVLLDQLDDYPRSRGRFAP